MNTARGMMFITSEEAKRLLKIKIIASYILNGSTPHNHYELIHVPLLYSPELFIAKSDEINHFKSFLFEYNDFKGRKWAFKPEITIPVLYYHNQYRQQQKVRYWYYDKVYRYERPQKGRRREFWQLGVENLSQAKDGWILDLLNLITLLKRIIPQTCSINIRYNLFWKDRLFDYIENLPFPSQIKKQWFQLLDKDHPICKYHQDRFAWYYKDSAVMYYVKKFALLISTLKNSNITFSFDPKCVRGLDYYHGLVYEIDVYPSNDKDSHTTVAGGGEYNIQTKKGSGWGLGMSRMLESSIWKDNVSQSVQDPLVSESLQHKKLIIYVTKDADLYSLFEIKSLSSKINSFSVWYNIEFQFQDKIKSIKKQIILHKYYIFIRNKKLDIKRFISFLRVLYKQEINQKSINF